MSGVNKDMDNFSTVKVNPYEIAKASDMDFGFKNILANLSIFVDRFFGYHSPELNDTLFDFPTNIGKIRKDFIIGGGLVAASDLKKIGIQAQRILRPLPMVAFSKSGGIFVTNGLTVDNRPYHIPIGQDFYEEGYRIESIYIGNAKDDEHIHGTVKNKKDPDWDEFQSETRAAYKIQGASDETVFSTFYKRQMQAVRFYVLHGMVAFEKKDARAADTPKDAPWDARVKIAEVLVHCKKHSDEILYIQPIERDDVRFVTAVQYAQDSDSAKYDDVPWIAHAKRVHPLYPPNATLEEKERLKEKAEQQTENNKAYRAEHYNYRWTNEQTSTYRLGSIAEISERLYAFHKTDGSLKETVVKHFHIDLSHQSPDCLNSARIPVGVIPDDVDTGTVNIALPYGEKISPDKTVKAALLTIADHLRAEKLPVSTSGNEQIRLPYVSNIHGSDTIKGGLLKLAQALLKADEKIDNVHRRLNNKIDGVDRRLDNKIDSVNNKLDNHISQADAHAATSSAAADRIALRDGFGRFEVENPVFDKQVVNINYLNSTFKMDIVMKVLKSKYITTQGEFDAWIRQRRNEAYTYVYLKGVFKCRETIKLKEIGTTELIGLPDHQGRASIYITINSSSASVEAGIDGDNSASLKDIWIEVKGKCIGSNRVIGFEQCTCSGCKAVVVGDDGANSPHYIAENASTIEESYTSPPTDLDGENGAHAVGFYGCRVDRCEADIRGGKGGNGAKLRYDDYSWIYYKDTCYGVDGGKGGDGGNATSFNNGCTFITNPLAERVVGGNGGDGGNAGNMWERFKGRCGWADYKYRDGNAGNGGKGGDATGKSGLTAGSGGSPGRRRGGTCPRGGLWEELGGTYPCYGDDGRTIYI